MKNKKRTIITALATTGIGAGVAIGAVAQSCNDTTTTIEQQRIDVIRAGMVAFSDFNYQTTTPVANTLIFSLAESLEIDLAFVDQIPMLVTSSFDNSNPLNVVIGSSNGVYSVVINTAVTVMGNNADGASVTLTGNPITIGNITFMEGTATLVEVNPNSPNPGSTVYTIQGFPDAPQ